MTTTRTQGERRRRLFRTEEPSTFDERRSALVDFFADRTPGGYLNRIGFIEVAARLHRGGALDAICPTLNELLDRPQVDGAPVDYAGWPLFAGPFLRAEPGSRRLELRYGKLRRRLDFETATITDWIAK